MREILGRRRRTRTALLGAAIRCAEQWRWPVVPGVPPVRRGRSGPCGCPRTDCPVPGAHPYDPPLLAATTDPRMVRWWWSVRPDAPLIAATGERFAAISLPAEAGARVLDYFDALRVRTGPVIATPSRHVLLVAPYSHDELGELLVRQEYVPSSLRYHGPGGFVVMPPSRTGAGAVRWEREPGDGIPWLPQVSDLVEALVAAGASAPDGTRLAY